MTLPLRTVLFDLDGTLIDSRELILASFRHTMRHHLGSVPADASWLAGMGTPLVVQLRGFARSPEEAEAMFRTYTEHNARLHDDLIRPFPGVRETVTWLREAGYRLGIVTSKLRVGTIRGLRTCGMPREWFDAIVTASDPVPHKPDPAPVLRALETLEEKAARALFVGDSVWDLRAGRAAGTRTAAALWGPFARADLEPEEPDHLLETVAELRELVAREGAPSPRAAGGPEAPPSPGAGAG